MIADAGGGGADRTWRRTRHHARSSSTSSSTSTSTVRFRVNEERGGGRHRRRILVERRVVQQVSVVVIAVVALRVGGERCRRTLDLIQRLIRRVVRSIEARVAPKLRTGCYIVVVVVVVANRRELLSVVADRRAEADVARQQLVVIGEQKVEDVGCRRHVDASCRDDDAARLAVDRLCRRRRIHSHQIGATGATIASRRRCAQQTDAEANAHIARRHLGLVRILHNDGQKFDQISANRKRKKKNKFNYCYVDNKRKKKEKKTTRQT